MGRKDLPQTTPLSRTTNRQPTQKEEQCKIRSQLISKEHCHNINGSCGWEQRNSSNTCSRRLLNGRTIGIAKRRQSHPGEQSCGVIHPPAGRPTGRKHLIQRVSNNINKHISETLSLVGLNSNNVLVKQSISRDTHLLPNISSFEE